MKLQAFPEKLYEIELGLIQQRRLLGNNKKAVDRNRAALAEAAAKLNRKDYPNAEARSAWLEIQLGGEAHMSLVRQMEKSEDLLAQQEAEHTKVRRQWKVAQIAAQFRMREFAERYNDERPEQPQPVDTYEGEGIYDGPGSWAPNDEVPF